MVSYWVLICISPTTKDFEMNRLKVQEDLEGTCQGMLQCTVKPA